jgi:hypothetical protein
LRAEIKARAFSSSGSTSNSRRYRKPVIDTEADEENEYNSSPVKSAKKKSAKICSVIDGSAAQQLNSSGIG